MDGSYSKNSGKAGFGIHFAYQQFPDISLDLNHTEYASMNPTSNTAELAAIDYVLDFAVEKGFTGIHCYSDSEFSLDSITKFHFDYSAIQGFPWFSKLFGPQKFNGLFESLCITTTPDT